MSAVRIIRRLGCKLAITVFAFEIQLLLGLLAFVVDFILIDKISFWLTRLCDFILVEKILRRNHDVLKGLSLL